MTPGDATIPVARPLLPTADRIAPYLREIDGNRYYSNFGPLVQRLEQRLAAHFGAPAGGVCCLANATLGLVAALGPAPRADAVCILPAWTFVATGHAARAAGYQLDVMDVSLERWALEPERVAARIAAADGCVAAVMPVAPFGAPLDPEPWRALAERTGVRIVVDAAAAFDAFQPDAQPAVVSLHATKALGAGEGGFVIAQDTAEADRARRYAQFGFARGGRVAQDAGSNAKMSEYAAAVALAALDDWPDARADWRRVARGYRDALAHRDAVRFAAGYGADWVASSATARLIGRDAAEVASALAARGIETRDWWGGGLAAHPAFADAAPAAPPNTALLAQETLSLPCFRDMTDAQVARVAAALCDVLG